MTILVNHEIFMNDKQSFKPLGIFRKTTQIFFQHTGLAVLSPQRNFGIDQLHQFVLGQLWRDIINQCFDENQFAVLP